MANFRVNRTEYLLKNTCGGYSVTLLSPSTVFASEVCQEKQTLVKLVWLCMQFCFN